MKVLRGFSMRIKYRMEVCMKGELGGEGNSFAEYGTQITGSSD